MSSKYTWVITKDHLFERGQGDDKSAVGTIGPRGTTLTRFEVAEHTTTKRFRMKDSDGEIYCEGYICGDFDGFEPKDDFGEPSLGCTDIEYLENEKWVAI